MIKQDDKMKLSIALQDYDKQMANYHFYNWEVAELERCENEIKKVIVSYTNNFSDLRELLREFPSIQQFMPESLMQEIQQSANSQENKQNVFYSFDGQKFSTIEEAAARNEYIQYAMSETSKTR